MGHLLLIIIGAVSFVIICIMGVALGGTIAAYVSRGKEIEEIQAKHRSDRTERIRHEIGKGFGKKIELPEDSFEKFFNKLESKEEAEHVKNKYIVNKKLNVKALISRGMSR